MADGAPFSAYRTVVRAEWLDYNGHLHDASYGIILSDANEAVFEVLDLSEDYRATTGASFYTVETHIRFLAECSLGESLRAATVLVDASPRKIRLYTELLLADERPAATGESLYLHVDTARGVTTAMSPKRYSPVEQMLSAHADLPRPAHLGLGVGAAPGAEAAR
jgi:acyl-CoA thioesterase FadM